MLAGQSEFYSAERKYFKLPTLAKSIMGSMAHIVRWTIDISFIFNMIKIYF